MSDGDLPAARSYACCTRIACIVAGIFFGVATAVGQLNDTSRALDLLRSAQREASSNSAGAYRDLRELIEGPLLQDLDAERQLEALSFAVRLAGGLGRFEDAHALVRRLSEHERAGAEEWIRRFSGEAAIGDYPAAVSVLKEIASRWPEQFTTLDPGLIDAALDRMKSASRADLTEEALGTLFEGRWLAASGQEPSSAWRDLAVMRLQRNDLPGAVEVAARVTSPTVLIRMRVDKRFDAIVAALPARFDIARAIDVEIDSLRSALEADPTLLHTVVLLVTALQSANRLDEALALADAALERATNPNRVSPYTDGRERVVWLRNARARVLWTMGKHDEAAEELKKASDVPGNVSQRINYAGMLVRLGRGAQALPLVRDLNTSAYGDMQVAAIEVAAAVQVGDRRAASSSLRFLENHESDAISALQSGLMSMRDFDAAALVFIKRLESVETRGDALLEAQGYLDAPATPHETQRTADWELLLARPDVRNALDGVGRIESHPIHRP